MTQRAARVAKEIQRQLTQILREDLKDQRIGFTTITEVEMTPDLRLAKIYFTTLGGKVKENNATAALNQAKGFIRRLIGQKIKLRYVPELMFKNDAQATQRAELEALFDRIDHERQIDQENRSLSET